MPRSAILEAMRTAIGEPDAGRENSRTHLYNDRLTSLDTIDMLNSGKRDSFERRKIKACQYLPKNYSNPFRNIDPKSIEAAFNDAGWSVERINETSTRYNGSQGISVWIRKQVN